MKFSNHIAWSLLTPAIVSPVLQSCNSARPGSVNKPVNILLIYSDDQRAGTINALGNIEIITPNLDRLVKKGTSFTRAYIMGGLQGAVSVPSRAMLMTGKYLYGLEKTGSVIPEDHIMMGEYLIRNGYEAHGIGKWHNGKESYARNFSSGGHIFFGGMSDQFNIPVWSFDQTGKYQNDTTGNQPHIIKGKNATELFTDDAVKFLTDYKETRPFFLYVALTSPHDPREMPAEYLRMYDTSEISLPQNYLPQHPFDNGELKVRDELLAGFPRTKSEIKLHIRDYYAMITHMDAQIGRIIEALEESGEYKNTLIIFAGDNGLALGNHGLMGKQNVYEHSVGVPLIFSGPGIPENNRRKAMCYILDIFPTVCEELAMDIPSTVDGISLSSCIDSDSSACRTDLYFAYRDFQRAVRDDRYKLIEYNINGTRTTQLFDLLSDPMELKDLSSDPDFQVVKHEMRKLMLEEKHLADDQGTFWNEIEFIKN